MKNNKNRSQDGMQLKQKYNEIINTLSEEQKKLLKFTDFFGETVFSMAQKADRQDIEKFLEEQQQQRDLAPSASVTTPKGESY